MKVRFSENASKNKNRYFKAGDIIRLKEDPQVVLLYINNTTQMVLTNYTFKAGQVSNWAPIYDLWELYDGEVTISNE